MEILPYYHQVLKIWEQAARGVTSPKDFSLSEISKKLNSVFHVGPYYCYVLDLTSGKVVYIDPAVEEILGIKTNDFTAEFYMKCVHPEDLEFFFLFEEKLTRFFGQLKVNQLSKYKANYDLRIRHSSGKYKRIHHQIVPFNYTEKGEVTLAFGIHTDITHIKEHGAPKLSFIGMHGEPSYLNMEVEKDENQPSQLFSKREHEIVQKLCENFNNLEIADQLNISFHTVRTHRKNILRKANVKTTNELIIKVIKEGLI